MTAIFALEGGYCDPRPNEYDVCFVWYVRRYKVDADEPPGWTKPGGLTSRRAASS